MRNQYPPIQPLEAECVKGLAIKKEDGTWSLCSGTKNIEPARIKSYIDDLRPKHAWGFQDKQKKINEILGHEHWKSSYLVYDLTIVTYD